MLLLKSLCILAIIVITYGQPTEPGAACPSYSKGKCVYEEECPASSRHGLCGADKNWMPLVCCTSSGITTVLNYYVAREFPERTQCGRSGVSNQIYNGYRTEIGEYPWVAALLYVATNTTTYGGVKCGGTLITEKFVLTAVHCVIDQTAESLRVLLGDWNITSDPDPYPAGQCKASNCTAKIEYAAKIINATIDKLIPHELYSPKTKRNDIALLRLKTPVHFTDYVRPICLPSYDFPDSTTEDEVLVAGWGITETDSPSDILLKAKLNVLTNNACLDKIQKVGGIHETEFCAANGDSDACGGDSGGPLMKSYKDYHFNWFQLGIVESGGSCEIGATATVYTRVSSFASWIIEQITPESEINSPCITADNKNGSCVPVNQCPVLEQQYLQPGSNSEVEFIRRSLCGVFDDYRSATATDMVCCRLSQINRENAMEGSSCKTPEPELKDGRCVRITNCPALKDASKAAREYIQKYTCGFDDELLVCCKTQDIVAASQPKVLEEFSSTNIPNRTICGQLRSDNTKSEYPWLAALMYFHPSTGYKMFCGGSLINKRFVLTAASCLVYERKNCRVLLGTEIANCHTTSDCSSSMQNLTVEQAILHPFHLRDGYLNDIALVRLGSDVVFNDYVSPICLPPPDLQPLRRGSEVTVALWLDEEKIDEAYLFDTQICIDDPDSQIIRKQELCISKINISKINITGSLCSNLIGGSITRAYKDQLGQNLFLEGIDLDGCYYTFIDEYTIDVRISAYISWILRTITEIT